MREASQLGDFPLHRSAPSPETTLGTSQVHCPIELVLMRSRLTDLAILGGMSGGGRGAFLPKTSAPTIAAHWRSAVDPRYDGERHGDHAVWPG